MVNILEYHPQNKQLSNHLVQHNKQQHSKELLNSFYLSGNTLGLLSQN